MSISIRNRSMTVFVLFLSLFVFSLGCASGGGGAAETPSGPSALSGGKRIGQLSMSVSDALTEDAVEVAEQYSIINELDTGVRRELTGTGMADGGSLSVEVEIVGLRVRSTSAAIWWGMMAGSDSITVQVSVTENGRSIKDFETGTSTALGGFAYGGRGKRITRMLNTLAKRIASGI